MRLIPVKAVYRFDEANRLTLELAATGVYTYRLDGGRETRSGLRTIRVPYTRMAGTFSPVDYADCRRLAERIVEEVTPLGEVEPEELIQDVFDSLIEFE